MSADEPTRKAVCFDLDGARYHCPDVEIRYDDAGRMWLQPHGDAVWEVFPLG